MAASPVVNTDGNYTDVAMAYLQDEKSTDDMDNINLEELDLTTDEFVLDEVDIHIQANLEDDLVKEALRTGVDLRQYSKQVESELHRIEQASIKDCIPPAPGFRFLGFTFDFLTVGLSDIKESQNIASLHNQIAACDSILETVSLRRIQKPELLSQVPEGSRELGPRGGLVAWSSQTSRLQAELTPLLSSQRMEGMLSGFQSDLSSISSEIQTLQQQSVSMNVRLKNRQAVRSHLSQLVDELVVPGAMICTILESPVTEQEFLEQLHELNTKINFAKELSFRETLACSDIQDILDRLKLKWQRFTQRVGLQAVSKIREFILQKIYSFRKPMTNYQIPQNTLLKYRFFYQFLLANERTVAKEIRDEYVDTMSKIYCSYFKSYSSRLLKVQYEDVADKDDLMGVEDTAKKGFFSKPSLKSRNTIFTLGQRGAILSPAELEGPILVPHTAQRGDSRYPYETLFRSQHYALLDNGCREFLFLSDFFMVVGNSALDLFNSIMGKTLSMFLVRGGPGSSRSQPSPAQTHPRNTACCPGNQMESGSSAALETNRFTSMSLVCCCVCRRACPPTCPTATTASPSSSASTSSCASEPSPPRGTSLLSTSQWLCCCLAGCRPQVTRCVCARACVRYWEAVLEMLWPRFELILEMNIHSIRNTDPQKLGVLDTRPHYITRRYAEFSSAIVSINQTFPNERTNLLLGQLQVEVENFVLKMAAEFPSRRDQLIFLINNYDMMLSVLMASFLTERAADDSKEVEGFQQLLLARTQEFIEEILSPPFGGMIAFVKEAEALMEKGQLERLRSEEARITQLVRGFSSTWKQSVEAMSRDVMRSFTNFKNGTSIIQGALTQLIQYYHGFHKVLNQPTFRSLAVRSELINLHHLMVEVKKHKPNF
ncbi:unnamed protein product [Tetraodon nigroviridis]|uniref:Vacuolar protein sorting-associated protein 52 homolog n=2 Tax=Percomorphaceae TaxID=1489872 RepID=Q4TAG5_TETNG|nr:unnamed protein product [Tetraodon nigroviridis]